MKKKYFISDIEKMFKIHRNVIRYWERKGLMEKPKRSIGNYRFWYIEDVMKLKKKIERGRQDG